MATATSIFTQIIDKVRFMNDEQQKLLWLQLNQESFYKATAKADKAANGNVSMDEIIKMTRNARRNKKKN